MLIGILYVLSSSHFGQFFLLHFFRARVWATYCWPNQDWASVESLLSLYSSNKVLCGRHFSTSQFYDNKRQKLSIFAIPDLHDKENLLYQVNKPTSFFIIGTIHIQIIVNFIQAVLIIV